MRQLILVLHTSLDGYAAGPNGEMDWIKFDEALFDFVGTISARCDTALYGRVTYDMMAAYWPNAGAQPNATKHAKEHSAWYNKVEKVVVSETLQSDPALKLNVIAADLKGSIEKLKSEPGQDILLLGSPSIVRELMEFNLIDDYWLFMNPIVLGNGIASYAKDISRLPLELADVKIFDCGVAGMNFKKK